MRAARRGETVVRRVILAVLATVLVVAGCGGPGGPNGAGAAPAGPVLTNTAGRSTTLPAVPRRIVMDAQSAAALWGYGIRPIALIGALTDDPVTLGDVDPAGIQTVPGGFDVALEKLAAVAPDLVIASNYFCGDTFGRGPETAGSVAPFATTINNQIAPCLAISTTNGVLAQLATYADVAKALGGTVDSPQVAADRQAFQAVSEEIRDQVRRRPEIEVAAYSTSGAKLFALSGLAPGRQRVRAEDPGFRYLADELGLRVLGPQGTTTSFVQVSVEQLSQERADVVFVNTNRRTGTGPTQFPTWVRVPAVAAGQTATFDDYRPTTYRAWTDWMRGQVVPALQKARNLA